MSFYQTIQQGIKTWLSRMPVLSKYIANALPNEAIESTEKYRGARELETKLKKLKQKYSRLTELIPRQTVTLVRYKESEIERNNLTEQLKLEAAKREERIESRVKEESIKLRQEYTKDLSRMADALEEFRKAVQTEYEKKAGDYATKIEELETKLGGLERTINAQSRKIAELESERSGAVKRYFTGMFKRRRSGENPV